MQKVLKKLTYANVMATAAVFIALGGASYAATNLPQNSVGTAQLKNGSISAAKLKGGAVTQAKIGKEAVTGGKIKLSTLGTVPSAATATNAQTLGGLTASQITNQAATQGAATARLRCSAGTTPSSGLCFSEQHPAAGWYQAIETCGKEDMTLPTPAEVYVYGRANNQTNTGFEWTGNAVNTTEALEIEAFVGGNGAAEGNVFGTSDPFHCVGYPTN